MPTISRLFIYPIKSCQGIEVSQYKLDAFGPRFDRRWCVVDEQGKFITQRQTPCMALIATRIENTTLVISAPGMPELIVTYASHATLSESVTIWSDHCQAAPTSSEADQWFSDFLQRPCRLVAAPENFYRPVDPSFASNVDRVGFADGFPLLLVSQGALDLLNTKLASPVEIERFRPNVVIANSQAHEEDHWQGFDVGHIGFRVVKPCARCAIPNIDPSTAKKSVEPMKTLATYRRGADSQIYFGQNIIHNAAGMIRVGDNINVTHTKPKTP